MAMLQKKVARVVVSSMWKMGGWKDKHVCKNWGDAFIDLNIPTTIQFIDEQLRWLKEGAVVKRGEDLSHLSAVNL